MEDDLSILPSLHVCMHACMVGLGYREFDIKKMKCWNVLDTTFLDQLLALIITAGSVKLSEANK